MEISPFRAGSLSTAGAPQLRQRGQAERSSSGSPPTVDAVELGPNSSRISLDAASFSRQQSALESGQLPTVPPIRVLEADAPEPAPPAPTRWQRTCGWAHWGLRRALRFVPLVTVYAATIATTALVFSLKNFSILDQSRAATLVRLLRGEVSQAHGQIIETLGNFATELNATLANLCRELRRDD